MTNHPADPRDDPNMVQIPFIFVKHGDPLPVQWMAEHPDYFKVPAIMVPHGSPPPWPWRGANAGPLEAAREPALAVKPRVPAAFAPPPARRKHMPGGQPWPKDGKGRDWPKDRWGRPMRPLWDYPPGVRAPGEGVAPGAPGSIDEAHAINTYRKIASNMNSYVAGAQVDRREPCGLADGGGSVPGPTVPDQGDQEPNDVPNLPPYTPRPPVTSEPLAPPPPRPPSPPVPGEANVPAVGIDRNMKTKPQILGNLDPYGLPIPQPKVPISDRTAPSPPAGGRLGF